MNDTLLNDRYLITAELGRGGMGVVYRANDTLLGRDVAIKVMSVSELGTGEQARLMQEARAAASLNHPNVVAVHDVGEAQFPGQSESSSYITNGASLKNAPGSLQLMFHDNNKVGEPDDYGRFYH